MVLKPDWQTVQGTVELLDDGHIVPAGHVWQREHPDGGAAERPAATDPACRQLLPLDAALAIHLLNQLYQLDNHRHGVCKSIIKNTSRATISGGLGGFRFGKL